MQSQSRRQLPLPERRRQARMAARARVAARTTRTISDEQRRRDPLERGRVSRGGRVLRAIAAVLGSLLAHAAILAAGFGISGLELGRQEVRQQVAIEVREREPPPPPPPPPPPEPEPPKVVERPTRPLREPPPEPPPPEPKAPPPRVVGLSLESTTEGGGGPAFAVGNTREGRTAERAVDPKQVPKEAPPPGPEPETTNKVASRIPVAGITITQPKRRRPSQPPYPEILKAQGLEANVPVLVTVGADGRVTAVRILKPSGYPEFDEAARAHAMSEEYEPATKNGEPIPYSFSFTYLFRLQDE